MIYRLQKLMPPFVKIALLLCVLFGVLVGGQGAEKPSLPAGLRVGAGSVEFEADDSMIIAGGIAPGKASGQEGKLRAVAVVLEKEPFGRLAIVACDILMITREWLDPVAEEIEKTTGIPTAGILINSTHTH